MDQSQPREIPAPEAARSPAWLDTFLGLLAAAYTFLLVWRPTPFFADDSFFYLQVGRNFALGYGSTFNRLMPTNGYHPLWMLLCAAVYLVFPNRLVGLHMIALLIVALNVIVLMMAERLLNRLHAPDWVAWTILIPFLFGLQLGTESSLSAALLAGMLLALYFFLERPGWKNGRSFNLLAALAVLSRLDSIFVVACVWIAILIWCVIEHRRNKESPALRIHLTLIPVYAILWGAYLASNILWFHIIMPISGLLKSHNTHDHLLGRNLPHTALLSLAICAISLLILCWRQRDRWFLFVELPFFIGIVMHAAYITLRMTSETRWTWYYVSWALLAALTASRAAGSLFRPNPRFAKSGRSSAWQKLRPVAIALAVILSLVLWYRLGWQHSREQMAEDTRLPAMQKVLAADHINRLLAYDQPGGMAYFTPISVVPLDGLMADLQFQTELAQHGIGHFIRKDSIDGFAGPTVPFDQWGKDTYCGHLFLESTRYTCEPWTKGPNGEPRWMITGVEVYSRLPLAPAGYIALPPSNIVWTGKDYLTVWKISAQNSTGGGARPGVGPNATTGS